MNVRKTDRPPPTVVGIDLGTTNSALAWTGTRGAIRTFDVPQIVAPGEVAARPVLPSFLYLPTDAERESGVLRNPWDAAQTHVTALVGEFARDSGALTPSRQVASAKSWLANAAVDRHAAILPWGADEGRRISPVEASMRVLEHLRQAWNVERAAGDERNRLEHQSIVLTVPASFDEEARELTVQAAQQAGLADLRLLEEPLAALYAWIAAHRRAVPQLLGDARLILVCDVGGGTTDFTLVRAFAEDGELQFERIAVGDHLLLGGDNLDLSLAATVERVLAAEGAPKLSLVQRQSLRRKCSAAKEQLLSDGGGDAVRITLLGAGRGVIGGGMSADLTRADVVHALAEGFLPLVSAEDLPSRSPRSGLRELGLPYESDPAVTRHLAGFLARAGGASGGGMAQPDAVLFNGGFFTPSLARDRVLDALRHWFGRAPRVLENARPDVAIAIGAAYYGRLRQDPGARQRLLIRAGSARAYYVGVAADTIGGGEDQRVAVCAMPRGTQEGTTFDLAREFIVMTNQPVAFTLYSTQQRSDSPNDIVVFTKEDDVHSHAPLVTSLSYGKRSRRVPLRVRLGITFTETGTLELWCHSTTTEHRWRLAFNLRHTEADALDAADGSGAGSVQETDDGALIEDSKLADAARLVSSTFGEDALPPEALIGAMENALGHGKQAWPLAVLRKLADALIAVEPGRRRGAAYEVRWLNLAGFCARPGFGTPLDPWRVSELRKVYSAGLAFPKEIQNQVEWLVLWQRVGAGFGTGQQRELAQRVAALIGAGQRKAPRLNPQIEREGWRLLGSLERLDGAMRTRFGDDLIERIRREPRNAAWLWAIGRLGSRAPSYGPLSSVVAPIVAERWIDRLLALKGLPPDAAAAIAQLGARTDDSARDISDDCRARACDRLREQGFADELVGMLLDVRPVDRVASARAFSDPLPEGLKLESARDSLTRSS